MHFSPEKKKIIELLSELTILSAQLEYMSIRKFHSFDNTFYTILAQFL